jgi:hypothetical protein
LLKDTTAAYQYQKDMYRAACPQPSKPDTSACTKRDVELTNDYLVIASALDAVTVSQGGKLPQPARLALKDIQKRLDQEAKLP